MLSSAIRADLAAELAEAERTRVPMSPLTAAHPGIDVVDAYEIQLINIRQRIAQGATVVGHKVGLSSEAMQKMMGVDEPDYGHLLGDMEVFEDVPVNTAKYLFPRVEVEVGFILAEDLPGAGCTEDDVLAATSPLQVSTASIPVMSISLGDTRSRPSTYPADEALSAMVSHSAIFQSLIRVSMSSMDGAYAAVAPLPVRLLI